MIRPTSCILILIAATGCHSRTALTPQQAQGQHVYQAACAPCHEDNDLALKKVPPNLHGLFSRKTLPDGAPATDAEVTRIVMNGKGLMPPFQYQMTQAQLNALIAYLHTGLR
jgi:mono/diheme cytochrome c family protein